MSDKVGTICNDAIVKSVEKDAVIVEMTVSSACEKCHAKSACMASQRKSELIKALNPKGVLFEPGEEVSVYMQHDLGVKAVLIGYLFPFIILIISLFLMYYLTQNELLSVGVTILSVAIYYLLIWLLNKGKKIDKQFAFFIKKKD